MPDSTASVPDCDPAVCVTSYADDLIAAARAYDRVPFRHQGRTCSGIDCIGLIVCAARDAGLDLPDRHDYARDPYGDELERALDETLIRLVHPEPAAVGLVRFADSRRHVALLTPERMIHAWDLVGYVCEHAWHPWFQVRTVKFYRIPGLWPS